MNRTNILNTKNKKLGKIPKVLEADTSNQQNTSIITNDSLHVVNNPQIQNRYYIYFNDEIGNQKDYRELFNLLRTANSGEIFVLFINNIGGDLHTGIEIINSIQNSMATVYTCISGPVYSVAPLIVLAGDKIFVEEHSFMMFHDYSGGEIGKGSEMEVAINHYRPFFKGFFEKVTKGFLNEKECKDILDGKDFYLNRKNIIKRLRKLKKLGTYSKTDVR